MSKLACTDAQTLDGQDGMSMEGRSLECECRRRLRKHRVRSNRLSYIAEYFDSAYRAYMNRVQWSAKNGEKKGLDLLSEKEKA